MINSIQKVVQSRDLVYPIMSFLDSSDLQKAGLTCKAWNKFSKTDSLWQSLCNKRWEKIDLTPVNGSWRQRFYVIRNWEKGDCLTEEIQIKSESNIQFFAKNHQLYSFSYDDTKIKLTNCSTQTEVFLNEPSNIAGYNLEVYSPYVIRYKIKEGNFKIFCEQKGQFLGSITDNRDNIKFSVNHKQLAIIANDGICKFWDLESQECLKELSIEKLLIDSLEINKWDNAFRNFFNSKHECYQDGFLDSWNVTTLEDAIKKNRKLFKCIEIAYPYLILHAAYNRRDLRSLCIVNVEQQTVEMIDLSHFKLSENLCLYDQNRLVATSHEYDNWNNLLKLNLAFVDFKDTFAQIEQLSLTESCQFEYIALWWRQLKSMTRVFYNPLSLVRNHLFVFSMTRRETEAETRLLIWNLKTQKLMYQKRFAGKTDELLTIDQDRLVAKTPEGLVTFNFNKTPLPVSLELEAQIQRQSFAFKVPPAPLVSLLTRINQVTQRCFKAIEIQFKKMIAFFSHAIVIAKRRFVRH